MLCVLAFGPLRGLRWETHTNNLHVRLDGLAHNMEGDKAPQVDVTLVVRHSISQLTEKDWEACSQTNTGLLHEVRWLAPLRLTLGRQQGHLLAALPPPRQFRGATALTHELHSSECIAAASAALHAAGQHMPGLARVTLRTWPGMDDREEEVLWRDLAPPLGALFDATATHLTLDAPATAALSAAGSRKERTHLPVSASSCLGDRSSSSGRDGVPGFSHLVQLDVDSSSLAPSRPFSLQLLGPLTQLRQLTLTCLSTQQPGWQAAVSALSGLQVLACHFTGDVALDMAGVTGCVARLPRLQALALTHSDHVTPPPAAAHDLDLGPLAAATTLRQLRLRLQGRRLLGLSGLSSLGALTSLHLGLTGWAKYHHPLVLAPLGALAGLHRLALRVRLRGKRARDIVAPCLAGCTRLTQLQWQVAACEEAGAVLPPGLPPGLLRLAVQEPPEWHRDLAPWVATAAGCSRLRELVLEGDLAAERDAAAQQLRACCPHLTRLHLAMCGRGGAPAGASLWHTCTEQWGDAD